MEKMMEKDSEQPVGPIILQPSPYGDIIVAPQLLEGNIYAVKWDPRKKCI